MSFSLRAGRFAQRPLYPWVLAVYPIALIAALNSGQMARHSVLVAVGGGLAMATLLVLGFRMLLRGWHKAAVAAGVAVVLFYAFGPVSTSLDAWSLDRLGEEGAAAAATVHRNASILSGLWSVVLAGAVFLIQRGGEARMASYAGALNLVAALLLVVATAQAIGSSSAPETHAGIMAASVDEPPGATLPDVYYIVLDGYARADVLEQYYGHDNSPFLDALRSSGFTINERSNANYYWTFLSLLSSLNMDYVPAVLGPVNRDSVDRRAAYAGIRNSAVSKILRNHGYQFMQLQSTWGATLENSHADTLVACGSKLFADEFLRTLAQASWLRALSAQASDSLAECHRQNFASLETIAALPERKFVFAHFLLPHHPYLFDRHGNVLNDASISNQFDFQSRLWEQRDGYLEQLLYVNDAVLTAVAQIKANSRQPPIIVLQSDHGPQLNNGLIETEQRRVRFANLAAFHLPHARPDLIPQGESAVNFFRRILSFYLKAELPPLESRHFYSAYRRPFALKDVTEVLRPQATTVVSSAAD